MPRNRNRKYRIPLTLWLMALLVFSVGILFTRNPALGTALGKSLGMDYEGYLQRHFFSWAGFRAEGASSLQDEGIRFLLPLLSNGARTEAVCKKVQNDGTKQAKATGVQSEGEKISELTKDREETFQELQALMEEEQSAARDRTGGAKEIPGQSDGETDKEGTPLQQEEAGPREDVAASEGEAAPFVPHERVCRVSEQEMADYDSLVKNFYTIDPTTMAGSNQLKAETFLARDLSIDKGGEGPQILIYHTHSQEGFSDSVAGDPDTTIVGVGEALAGILTRDYGYQVLHHTGEYDKQTRDNAYSRALPEIEAILQENPSIQVVIDLHRDEMPEGTRLVTEVDGKQTARFMFFNGLSRTRQTGNLDYLYNVYQEDNLAFSFQMQLKSMEYYPGLTRKIYLKGYRYNMHLCPRTLLIELGAQNNTLEEAVNACGPLAHLLDLVLSQSPGNGER